MAKPSPADEPTSQREKFLDWLYDNPHATLSQICRHWPPGTWRYDLPAQHRYLPEDPVVRARRERSEDDELVVHSARPIHRVAESSQDPPDPWTWTAQASEESYGIWRYRLLELRDAGLISYDESEDMRAILTYHGRTVVEERRAAHELRRRWRQQEAAVIGLLRWLNEQDPDGSQWTNLDGVLTSRHADFEGQNLSEHLFRRAAEYLHERGLIRGDTGAAEIRGPITAQITLRGQDCLQSGGDVNEFLRGMDDRTTAHNVHFHGPVGNVAWASTYVTQTASTTGLAGDEIGALVRAIAEAIPALGLPDEQAARVRSAVDTIEGELARQEPDQHIVRTMMRRTLDALAGATSSTLGLLLTGYAKELMRNAGIPI